MKNIFLTIVLLLALSGSSSLLYAQSTKGNESWDGSFYGPGFMFASGIKLNLAPGGNIYASGYFQFIEDVRAKSLAYWDGIRWNKVSDSIISDDVKLLSFDSLHLFAMGNFLADFDDTIRGVASWDGRKWERLTPNLDSHNGQINSVISQNGKWIIAGNFDSFNNTSAGQIVRWDGSSWFTFRGGIQDSLLYDGHQINALLVDGDDLYAAGIFRKIGDTAVSNIARWNEKDKSWHPLGLGVNGAVTCLAKKGDTLYAGGSFTSAGGKGIATIAMWNGSEWYPVGSPKEVLLANIRKIIFEGDTIHILGDLIKAGKIEVHSIVSWIEGRWSNTLERYDSSGNKQSGYTVGSIMDLLIANGKYYAITQGTLWNNSELCQWQDGVWVPVQKKKYLGLSGSVYAIAAVSDNEVYVGGNFRTLDGQNIRNLAKWNGSGWERLSSDTIDGTVYTILKNANDLYIGGEFSVRSTNIKNITNWDGKSFHYMGPDADTSIFSLYFVNDHLYAAGYLLPGESYSYRFSVRQWNGASWKQIGPARSYFDDPLYLSVLSEDLQGRLLACGNNLCKVFDGNQWKDLTSDTVIDQSSITSIGKTEQALYLTGNFYPTNSTYASLAMIDKGSTIKYDTVFNYYSNYPMRSIVVRSESDIYALGERYRDYGYPETAISGIGHFNGTRWEQLGLGIEYDYANTIAASTNEVFVGGSFWSAGDKRANGFALWHIPPPASSVKISEIKDEIPCRIYPNPADKATTVQIAIRKEQYGSLVLFDLLGRKLRTIFAGILKSGIIEISVQLDGLVPGVYLLSLQTDGGNFQNNLVVN